MDDLVEGMVRMMDTEGFSGPVNLGNPEEFTMLELAEKVIEMTGSSSKTVFRPLPLDDPTQRKPDIRLAEEKLGWKPHITLEKGLEKPLPISGAFFRNQGMPSTSADAERNSIVCRAPGRQPGKYGGHSYTGRGGMPNG